MSRYKAFDELTFFSNVKRKPGMYLGKKSFISFRDQLFGMTYAFSACGKPDAMRLFKAFIEYYNQQLFLTDQNSYACWWNHILYTSGGDDNEAFDSFYRSFEAYLLEEHKLVLPIAEQ